MLHSVRHGKLRWKFAGPFPGRDLLKSSNNVFYGTAGFIIFVACWWLVSALIGRERLPPPSEVVNEFYVIFVDSPILSSRGGPDTIIPHITSSIIKYASGVFVGVASGIALGLLMKLSRSFHDFLILPVESIRTIPALAFTPFLLLWFGPTATSVVLLIIIYSALMLVITTLNAIDNVPPIYAQFSQTFGATRSQTFRTVIIPAIMPELRGGIRVALARSWGLVIVAELMGSPRGLGKALTLVTPYFAVAAIIAVIFITTILANVTDFLFLVGTRRLTDWTPKGRS